MRKFPLVPFLLVTLHICAVFAGPTGVVTRAVKPSQASAARLHEIVTRLQEYIVTITEELKSFEHQLKKESQGAAGEPHGMVVTDGETEKPGKMKTSTVAPEQEEEEEDEEEETDDCHCDCDALGLGKSGSRKRRAGSKVNGKHVAEILKTIRELLHEAEER